ncbi:MAG: Smr/MutS family protein [Gemmatimonadota bacterium]
MMHDESSVAAGVPATDTGTPQFLPEASVNEALESLEFALVLERVAGFAAGPLGAEAIRRRRPTGDMAWIEAELAVVNEAAGLVRTRQGISSEPVPDVSRATGRLGIEGSVLEIGEMISLRLALAAARLVSGELKRVEKDAPRLFLLQRPLPSRTIERRLELAFDTDGYLLDTASPGLAAARKEVRAARDRLVKRLESLLRSSEGQGATSESAVTVRNGRYVIPLRRDSRSRPGGIVHDESASGGTLFVEPAEAIELGNALRSAEAAEEREVLKVLRDLTDLLRPERDIIAAAHAMCVLVDDIVARGRYAAEVDGQVPAVREPSSPVTIRNGRHPLLFGGDFEVIPFNLDLIESERTVLISGPNTGGKTVLLKAVGLIAAMTQSGIIPPVGGGTVLPVFQRMFTDIGDRQSIAASLSTFSAHVKALKGILENADIASLILLDEVGSGTDPAEGAALAAAALLSLTRRRALTLASTHLGTLKQLASVSAGVVNASLEFDASTLSPTYRFLKGVPGRSYGLAIARRLGVPEPVLVDAESQVPDSERHLDAVLAAAEQRERQMNARAAALEERASGIEALAARLAVQASSQEIRETELKRKEREAEKQARKETKTYLMEARRRVEAAISTVQTSADEAVAREARRQVEEGIKVESQALAQVEEEEIATRSIEPVGLGQRVRIGQGSVGEVREIRPDGKLVVFVGAMRMVVNPAMVTPLSGDAAIAKPAPRSSPASEVAHESPTEIDLRGMTGDEAESATIAAVDGAVLAELPYLRIIHGMGTGVVRERVRRVVTGDRRIRSFGFAPANQGGTGVTIVEFAE